MSAETLIHRTVLLAEAVDALSVKPDGIYVDCTFGRGGHSRRILQQLGPQGRLIAFDKDPAAIANAQTIDDGRFQIVHDGFVCFAQALEALGVAQVDGVLMDLGISSPQIDEAERGFSFRFDAPLDMRMDTTRGLTAAQWLAEADEARWLPLIEDFLQPRWAALRPAEAPAVQRYRDWTQALALRAATSAPGRSLRQVERRLRQWAGQPMRELQVLARGEQAFFQAKAAGEAGRLSWADVAWVKEQWGGKLILKGIMDAEDARLAVDSGADALIVSNHGGRQLDGAPSSIAALPSIAAAAGKDIEVWMDGGIRSGQDVLKAWALGARGTMIGRAMVYGLGAMGEAGVTKALQILHKELDITMAFCGHTNIQNVDQRILLPGTYPVA